MKTLLKTLTLLICSIGVVGAQGIGKVEVPEHWKKPFGPYIQAPSPFKPLWYVESPFNPVPWKSDTAQDLPEVTPDAVFPPGFISIFGTQPLRNAGHRRSWEQQLSQFNGAAAVPPDFSAEEVDIANTLYIHWGMGTISFYNGRYGWKAVWKDCKYPPHRWDVDMFDISAEQAIKWPHHTVAQYQIRLAQRGDLNPNNTTIHPYTPPHIVPELEEEDDTADLLLEQGTHDLIPLVAHVHSPIFHNQ